MRSGKRNRARVQQAPSTVGRETVGPDRTSAAILRAGLALARRIDAGALLLPAPWDSTTAARRSRARRPRRIPFVTRDAGAGPAPTRPEVLVVPAAPDDRLALVRLVALLAVTRGALRRSEVAVAVVGPTDPRVLDTLHALSVEREFGALFGARGATGGLTGVRAAVLQRVVLLATELGREGREGQPVGTLFVLGDAERVLALSRQMILNPFQGHRKAARTILDERLTETVKGFATLDGAFVVADDGGIVTAGAFLLPPAASDAVPLGLGARHQAGAAITLATGATAVVLSQSTGVVTLFRRGRIVTTLPTRTSAGPSATGLRAAPDRAPGPREEAADAPRNR